MSTTTTPLDRLTDRQRDIIALAAEGCGIDAIAHRLGVGRSAVCRDVRQAADVLGVGCGRPLTWLVARYVMWTEQGGRA